MIHLELSELKKQRRLAITWGITFLVIFPLLIFLGFLMSYSQGEKMKLLLANFYAFMTLHGLGMTMTLFSMSFSAVWCLLSTRYVKLNMKVGYFVYSTFLMGIIGLAISTLIGKFGPGSNIEYPLTFKDPTWFSWSIPVSIISLMILGIALLTGTLHVLFSLAKKHGGLSKILGWQYFGKTKHKEELPPIILITTISFLAGILAIAIGMSLLFIYLNQYFEKALIFDALLLNNMTFFFGDTLSNVSLFTLAGLIYTLLPEFTGRTWKTKKVLVFSWNATLLLILFACFQYVFLDFLQPFSIQYLGVTASHIYVIPVTIITMSGIFFQFYKANISWDIIPLMILMGMAGWVIGSFTALVNSSLVINRVMNDTLWVPAQIHTYALMGSVLFILAFLFYLFPSENNRKGSKLAKTGFWIFVSGSYGFLIMLYIGGLNSIPRNYARYTGMGIKSMHTTAVLISQFSALFIIFILAGLFIMYFSLFARLRRKT